MDRSAHWAAMHGCACEWVRIALDALCSKVRVLETLRIGDIRSNMRAKGRRIAFVLKGERRRKW